MGAPRAGLGAGVWGLNVPELHVRANTRDKKIKINNSGTPAIYHNVYKKGDANNTIRPLYITCGYRPWSPENGLIVDILNRGTRF